MPGLFFHILLAHIPAWVFIIPLVFLTLICIRFRKRKRLSITCVVMILVIGTPFLHREIMNRTGGGAALEAHLGVSINDNYVTYLHQLIGIEDHKQYWKVKHMESDKCNQVIQQFSLKPISDNRLFRLMSSNHPPMWWPKTMDLYSIYKGDDGNLGLIELWMPKEGSIVFIFKFSE